MPLAQPQRQAASQAPPARAKTPVEAETEEPPCLLPTPLQSPGSLFAQPARAQLAQTHARGPPAPWRASRTPRSQKVERTALRSWPARNSTASCRWRPFVRTPLAGAERERRSSCCLVRRGSRPSSALVPVLPFLEQLERRRQAPAETEQLVLDSRAAPATSAPSARQSTG